MNRGTIVGLSQKASHSISKDNVASLRLVKGEGVAGDAHAGTKVKHRSRVARDPDQPNLRQVHLIHAELHSELNARGFSLKAGQMGENITTRGIDLMALPRNAVLKLGEEARVKITGLRNPCKQLNGLQPGLMQAVLDQDEAGKLIRKAGVMGIVLQGGELKIGGKITIEYPEEPFLSLEPV